MSTFDFELVFTGMCLLELDGDPPTRCTVHIPNAADPDVVFKDVPEDRRPFKHVPLLSFPTKFQKAGGSQLMRPVDRVFPAADGEEIGVCGLAGETLTLQPPGGSPPLSLLTVKTAPEEVRAEDLFDWTSSLQDLVALSGCTFTGIKSSEAAVATRVNLAHGQFGTLECGRQNGGIVVYEYNPVQGGIQPRPGRSLADAVVLRLSGLTSSVVLGSNSLKGDFYFFPLLPLPADEVVRICISNFHETPQPNRNGLFDFLWYYNILEGLEGARRQSPDPLDLFVPYIPESMSGPITGSSGHCPPTLAVIVPKTELPNLSELTHSGRVEGIETEPDEFPGSVALLGPHGSLVGSGVLLDDDIVLTAGHVLEERPATVVVGTSVATGSRHPLRAGLHRRPGSFDGGSHKDDLLLLRLTAPVGGFDAPDRATAAEVDGATVVTVVGFGFGNSSGPRGIQRKTAPPLRVRHASCPNGDPSGCHAGKELVTDESGPGGVFAKDSGAPAYAQAGGSPKLVAIASRTVPGDQGIYVRLDAHEAWMEQAVNELKDAR